MALEDIVDVQITKEIAAITRVGFGTGLFINESDTAPAAVVTEYASLSEVADDYAVTDQSYLAAQAYFSQELSARRFKVAHKTEAQTYAEALQAAIDFDNDFYAVMIESRTLADIQALAADIEARKKLFLAVTADSNVLDPAETSVNIASVLLSNSYSRTALFYEPESDYLEVALAGRQLPTDPGSTTWAFKNLAGIVGRTFTGSQITALKAKNVTSYQAISGLNLTIGTETSDAGSFIDIVRGIDWLEQRLAEDIFVLLSTQPKVPFTNAGIASVEATIRNRLDDAVVRNVIAPEPAYTVSVPDVLATEATDRAARLLRDVTFNARLAGAIHEITVRGTVTV